MKKTLLLVVACAMMLCACSTKTQPEPQVSPTVTPTKVPAPTSTPVPTPTVSPTSTPIPTATDIPTPTPTEIPPKSSLDILREALNAEDALCGVAFLSYMEGEYADVMAEWEKNGLFETYPFLQDIAEEHTILTGGGEWFLLVPAEDEMTVSVYESTLDYEEFVLKPGKELYRSNTGTPILIRGNVSDIYPSTVVVLERNNIKIEYSPCLSLKDGSLAEGEGIYNMGQ